MRVWTDGVFLSDKTSHCTQTHQSWTTQSHRVWYQRWSQTQVKALSKCVPDVPVRTVVSVFWLKSSTSWLNKGGEFSNRNLQENNNIHFKMIVINPDPHKSKQKQQKNPKHLAQCKVRIQCVLVCGVVWLLRKTGQSPEGNSISDWLALAALKADSHWNYSTWYKDYILHFTLLTISRQQHQPGVSMDNKPKTMKIRRVLCFRTHHLVWGSQNSSGWDQFVSGRATLWQQKLFNSSSVVLCCGWGAI